MAYFSDEKATWSLSIPKIIDVLLDEVKAVVRDYTKQLIVRMVKLLAITFIGVVCLSVGLVVILYGTVKYLGLLVQVWIAWGLVGIIALLLGGLMLFLLRAELTTSRSLRL